MKKFINERSRDELALLEGSVYQVWEDGEITLQKSGPLLWQRSLHCIVLPLADGLKVDVENFPHVTHAGHGYAFVTEEGAREIREEVKKNALHSISSS